MCAVECANAEVDDAHAMLFSIIARRGYARSERGKIGV